MMHGVYNVKLTPSLFFDFGLLTLFSVVICIGLSENDRETAVEGSVLFMLCGTI